MPEVRIRLRSVLAGISGRRRSVLLTYPTLRMGNVLYFALQAHIRQTAGADWVVLDPNPGSVWAAGIPGLEPLLLDPSQLRMTDERLMIPELFFQEFGADFSATQLTAFIHDVLLTAPGLALPPTPKESSQRSLTVNVRRGDYYSTPQFRSMFGFDVVGFVRRAVHRDAEDFGRADRIAVVSDDAEWCRGNLGWLVDHAADGVEFVRPEHDVLGAFRRLARARRLVIANSTFSYWAAYTSNVLHGDNHTSIRAPRLHSRARRQGQPWQLDPRWDGIAVEDV